MFKDFIQSIYEKVYIINFEKCSQMPCLTSEELKSLGKWYVSTGKEWICHLKNGFVIQMLIWKNLKIYF
ncbi:TPA: DUF3884 family protein [Streptococcus pneumoniae]